MKQLKEEKNFLNMAGEYGVCSELQKRSIFANITYGKEKSADIIIVQDRKSWRVEVKTSMSNRIVTSFFQKFHTPETTPYPDFWVIVHIDSTTFMSDFYILTHAEMAKEQMIRNKMTEWTQINGVDNIELPQLEKYKNKWDTILKTIINGEADSRKVEV